MLFAIALRCALLPCKELHRCLLSQSEPFQDLAWHRSKAAKTVEGLTPPVLSVSEESGSRANLKMRDDKHGHESVDTQPTYLRGPEQTEC